MFANTTDDDSIDVSNPMSQQKIREMQQTHAITVAQGR